MKYIDNCAYTNRLNHIHPVEKILIALMTMIVCIVSQTIVVPFLIISIMMFLTVWKAGIPSVFYRKLLMIPLGFIILGLISIAINPLSGPSRV